ncbi:MAG: ferrous iron transport protein B [Bacillota bacterium]
MIYLLTGNPNVGKSTFFNALTESNVHVGNYPGVTVEKRAHTIKDLADATLVDLPGTYNVAPTSEDEGIVTKALLEESYNGIVNIIDSTHLKRNLQLTVQLLELGAPTLVVCNLEDALGATGYKVDTDKLKDRLNANVVSVTATKDMQATQAKTISALKHLTPQEPLHITYPDVVEEAIKTISNLLRFDTLQVNRRWAALQVLEGNQALIDYVDPHKLETINRVIKDTEDYIIKHNLGLSLVGVIFMTRRAFIESVVSDVLVKEVDKAHPKYFNQKVDRYLTHPLLGIPFFFFVMFMVYQISFGTFLGLGVFLQGGFEWFYDEVFATYTSQFLELIGFSGFIHGLIVDGMIAGVGGVLVFLPQIVILFFLLSILEGTGYMARVSMVMDRTLSKFGLNGRSIVPIITGFGCAVPAVMSTRTIADKKERFLTMLTLPFVSCSAKLPIYGIFVSLFFEQYRAVVMMGLYLLGIVMILIASALLKSTVLKGAGSKFALEVPPYRMPQLRTITYQALDKAKRFLKKAGTFILIGSMILWLLSNTGPGGLLVPQEESFLAYIAGFIAPIFIPLGFGTWQATSALISGFLAKEVVASSLIILYGSETAITLAFTIPSAIIFLVFSSLYVPCLATLATIKGETNSKKWTVFAVIMPFVLAYIVALLVRGIIALF